MKHIDWGLSDLHRRNCSGPNEGNNIVAIIIIVLLLKFLFAIFMIAPTGLHDDIQTLNFVINDLRISS